MSDQENGPAGSSLATLTSGAPHSVDIRAIQRDLAAFWEAAQSSTTPDGAPEVSRVCLLNLIVCCAGAEQASRTDAAIAAISEDHPARAIVLVEDDDAPRDTVESWITAHCHLASSRKTHVCCEQISVRTSTDAVGAFPQVAASLVVHDLPVFLWWRGDPLRNPELLRSLLRFGDRCMVDSADFDGVSAGYRALLDAVSAAGPQAHLTDLAWTRLLPWRRLIAALFDGKEHRERLQHLREVEVQFAGDAADSACEQAVLLAAWLAARLGWPLKPGTGGAAAASWEFSTADNTSSIVVRLTPAARSDPAAGNLCSIALHTDGGGQPAAVYRVERSADAPLARLTVEIAGACAVPRTVPLAERTEAQLLCGELENLAPDRVFEDALALAVRMLGG